MLAAVGYNQLAILGQFLFGFILYGRNADILYYFTYIEGSATLFSYYSMAIILPSIVGAACFPWMFRNRRAHHGTTKLQFRLVKVGFAHAYRGYGCFVRCNGIADTLTKQVQI